MDEALELVPPLLELRRRIKQINVVRENLGTTTSNSSGGDETSNPNPRKFLGTKKS